MKNRLLGVFFHWLPLAGAIVIIYGFTYLGFQQNYRMSLNDPQIEMAESARAALLSGKQPVDIVGRANLFDAGVQLTPFIAIYDASGKPLESSAFIENKPPQPPLGVFDYAKQYGEDRVSWQPNATTRIALIVVPVPASGTTPLRFVAAGRNMREVELRQALLIVVTALCLFTTLIVTFLLDILSDAGRRRMMEETNKK